MRFHVEFEGVIEAANEAEADALSEKIAKDTESAYRFRVDGGPDAVIASMSAAVVVPKQAAVA